MKINYNRELWDSLGQYHPKYYCDDRVLEYDILYRYLDEGEEALNKEDVPWIKSFSSLEEITSRMRSIEQQLYEEMIWHQTRI